MSESDGIVMPTHCIRCGLPFRDNEPRGMFNTHHSLNACVQRLCAELAGCEEKWCEQLTENKRLRTVLKSVEWLSDHDGVRWCPSCSCLWPEHASGCQLKAALDAAGEDK